MESKKNIDKMKHWTKGFAVDAIKFCDSVKICKARSKNEFFSKLYIVVEEGDESEHWLRVIEEVKLTGEMNVLNKLKNEIQEINKIMSNAKDYWYKKNN